MGNELTADKQVELMLLAADDVCPNSIVGDLCPDGGEPTFELDGNQISISAKFGDPEATADWKAAIAEANALALAVQYVDVITMDRLKLIYSNILQGSNKPFGVLVYRGAGEIDYKLSCPFCGQKLWVRDSDVNKRGRCPNCKKAFILPSQGDHVRTQLEVHADVPFINVEGGNASSLKDAFRAILNSAPS